MNNKLIETIFWLHLQVSFLNLKTKFCRVFHVCESPTHSFFKIIDQTMVLYLVQAIQNLPKNWKKKYFEIETWWISLLSSFVVHDWREQITKLISYSFYWHISTIFFWQTHAQGGHGHLPTHFRFIFFFLLDITYFFLDLSHWLLDKQQF